MSQVQAARNASDEARLLAGGEEGSLLDPAAGGGDGRSVEGDSGERGYGAIRSGAVAAAAAAAAEEKEKITAASYLFMPRFYFTAVVYGCTR